MSKYFVFFICIIFWGCQNQPSEAVTIFFNGEIITVNADNQLVESIAILEDKILDTGTFDEIKEKYSSKYQLKEINLEGKTLMPGLYDNHSHPVWGAMKDLYELNFPWYEEPDQLKQRIQQYINNNKPSIVTGGAWGSQYFEKYKIQPRQWLDEIENKIPIALFDDASHNLWVNSAGLRFGQIDKNTPDPKNGRIGKDESGEPNGILYENATFLIRDKIQYEVKQYISSIKYAQDQALSFGIIGVRDAAANEKSLKIFSDLDKSGEINIFFGLCQETPNMYRDTTLDVKQYLQRKNAYQTENVDPSFVKFFLDGIPTTSRTAAMLCSYKTDAHHSGEDHGMIHISKDILFEDVMRLDEKGFTIKIHAAGDSSARAAINAIEFARNTNGMNNSIHEIAHASYLADSDLPRMKKLKIAADLSPYLWYPSPIIDNILSAVCEDKGMEFWQIKKLYDMDIHCVAGSDWPAVAVDMNPWIGMEAMVTRKNPLLNEEASFLPEQAISLEQAIRIFTINGAESMKRKVVSGSLEKGKFADFIILDKPLLNIHPEEISDIKILSTYYKGQLKFKSNK